MKSKKKRNISDTNLLLTITIVVFFAMYIGAMIFQGGPRHRMACCMAVPSVWPGSFCPVATLPVSRVVSCLPRGPGLASCDASPHTIRFVF